MNHVENLEISSAGRVRLKEALAGRLRPLVGKKVLSPALATKAHDGRRIPLVFVHARAADGTSRAGVRVELLGKSGERLDETRTNRHGFAILRFPGAGANGHAHGGRPAAEAVNGQVRVEDGSQTGTVLAVEIPAGRQMVWVRFDLTALPALAEPAGAGVVLPAWDDPLARLPIDFSPEVCEELVGARTSGLLGASGPSSFADPLLPSGGAQSLTGQRTPLVRRFAVVRERADGTRYLLQLRQEWVLVGYTLGEIADVTALEPGAVLQKADQVVNTASSAVRRAVDEARSTLTSQLQDILTQLGSVDTTIRASLSTKAEGWYIGLPLIVGYGSAGVTVSEDIDTTVNTTFLSSRALHQAATLVNQAIAQAQSAVQGVQRTLMDVASKLAPLVSRAVNALRWRVYENYAVCTFVDSVHPITGYALEAGTPTFTADEVRALRPFFEPALLDPSLRPFFDDLVAAAAQPPVGRATIDISYDLTGPALWFSPDTRLRVDMGGATQTLTLARGRSRSLRFNVDFPAPLPTGTTVTASFLATVASLRTLTLRRVQIWAGRDTDATPNAVQMSPANTFVLDVPVGGASAIAAANALVAHINAHRSYYIDVLAAAALRFPHLRSDSSHLAGVPADVWRLPVVGFVGNEVLVVEPAASVPPAVLAELLERDPGSGTLIQLLAPGAYGELLQGVVALTDITNLHPALEALPTVSPYAPFPELPAGNGAVSSATGALGGATSGGTSVGSIVGGVVGSLPTGGLP